MNQSQLFDEFDISLYHLVFLGNLIEKEIEAFAKTIGQIKDEYETVFYTVTTSYILIQTQSFLDEYHNNIKSDDPETNKLVLDIKKALKPATAQIKEWKDLQEFRTQVLAHNLREAKDLYRFLKRA